MSLRDHFPRVADIAPDFPHWGEPFGWDDESTPRSVSALCGLLISRQALGLPEFFRFSEAIRYDLDAEKVIARTDAETANLKAARFAISVPPAHVAMALGVHGDCYAWVLWGASLEHEFDSRMNRAIYELPFFDHAQAAMNQIADGFMLDWIATTYLLAVKFGGLDELTREYFEKCFGVAFAGFARLDLVAAVQALSSLVNWATKFEHPAEAELVRLVVQLIEPGGLPPRFRTTLAFTLTTAAARFTDKTSQQWAGHILDELADQLIEHEKLQLLAVAMSSPAKWAEMRAEILDETRKLSDFYRAQSEDAVAAATALEARVAILYPLIFNLTEFGTTDDLIDLLWTWYGDERGGAERCDGNVLVVATAHGPGVTYLWPGGRWTVPPGDGETLQQLLDALSAALHEIFRGPAGDRIIEFNERMAGAPAFEEGARTAEAVARHYAIDELRRHLPEDFRPRSALVLPAHRDPLQAMLGDSLGYLTPLEASLERALPMRPVRSISIWPGATNLTDAEVQLLRCIARASGWAAEIVEGALDAEAFERFYSNPEPDVLWVIGHGEQSPFRVEESGIILDDRSLLPISRIASWEVPGGDRRLLVLNICSSGSVQNRGGIARVGLGHWLTSRRQAVVGHQWPVDPYAALAFAGSFCAGLTELPLAEAFHSAIGLMRNQGELLARLEGLDPELELIARLRAKRLEEHLANILNWGCPVLLT